MNEFSIQEENFQDITILHIEGNLSQKNWPKLDSILKNFLKQSSPEFILLEGSQIHYIEKECMLLLQKTAVLFSDQARELSFCSIPVPMEKNFFAPPLSYYETQQEAMQNFQKSQATMTNALELTIVAGPCKGSTVLKQSDKEVTIGRHSKCNLSIPQDIKSSRFHCKVYEKNGLFVLEDLQSSNGTFFEEKMITLPTEIKNNSFFQVGETRIQAKIIQIREEKENAEESPIFPSLPSLDFGEKEEAPTEEANIFPALNSPIASAEVGGMETVIGISLSDLLGDALKTDKNPVVKKAPTPSSLKIPEEKVFVSEKIVEQEEKERKFPNILDPESWSMLQKNLPSPLRRRGSKLTSQEIDNRYKIIKKKGESHTCLLLQCAQGKEQEKIFLQYSKEPMLVPDVLPIHPHVLLPQAQGDYEEKVYRAFRDPGESLPPLPLPDIKLLEIAIVLADVLKTFHEAGSSGFDIAMDNIFYKKNQLPFFALIPAVVYEDILGEAADFYSYGELLFRLSSGSPLPYTPIGTLDQEELEKIITRIPCPIWQILCAILKRQYNNWDKITSKFKEALSGYLSPKSLSQKTKILEIIKMENSLLYHFQGEVAVRLEWKQEIAQRFTQDILTRQKEKDLIPIAQNFYKSFYPVKIQQILEHKDIEHIVLNLDERLHFLPWEMAHNGESFLNQKIFIERKVFPDSMYSCAEEKVDSPRIFFISGNTPQEIEKRDSIVEKLQDEFPWLKIKTAYSIEDSYDILQRISQSDIVHIMLPIDYNQESPMDSGWILDGKKILKLRFLENAPRLPKLFFHQRTLDNDMMQGSLLSHLYQLQVPYVLGTLQTSFSCETIFKIYLNLLKGCRFYEAIQNAKKQTLDSKENSLSGLLFYGCGQKLLGIPSRFKG